MSYLTLTAMAQGSAVYCAYTVSLSCWEFHLISVRIKKLFQMGIMTIRVKRVYDRASKEDGTRILVDRLWPRGIRKKDASIDIWLKDIAPSNELRKWFNHDPDKWEQFKSRYFSELDQKAEVVNQIKGRVQEDTLTLVYSASDTKHNNAIALKEYLESLLD